MSLKHAANHLAAHGRGPDTELIHMTKGEIRGLQQLAMAGGGSLTINPHTGLAEAGFLSNMLPMIAGAAAMYFTGGAAGAAMPGLFGMGMPATIGLGIGGLETARTGSLQKGLMAGMGAYGGAGLAGGLMGAGASAVGEGALNQSAAESARLGLTQAPFDAAAKEAVASTSNADLMSKGVSSLGQPGGFTNLSNTMAASGGPSLGRAGLAAAAPMIGGMLQPTTAQPDVATSDGKMPQRLKYNPGVATPFPQPDVPGYGDLGRDFGKQQSYFPSAGYQNITDEEAKSIRGYAVGGLMPTQGGGPVEAMSNANAIGENTGFPMADINKGAYATPWQTPVSQNVVQGAADAGVNSMTGEQNEFAAGGETKEDIGYKGYKKLPENGSSDSPKSTPEDYARPSGQTPLEALASDAVAYSKAFGGALPGGLVAGAVGNAYRDYRANDAALNGGYSGMYTGDWSGGVGNTMTEAQTQAANAGTGGGPLSGDSWGGGPTSNDSGSYGSSDSSGDGSGGEANGGLAPHFPRHMARGGLSAAASHLGDYSDGGRLLKGPGDGVSDSIPAVIGKKRPARLADGEFVVPARIVSELGNGSTEAGARKLYAMLDRVQAARKKSIGKGKVAKNSRADKLLPA